MVLISLKFLFVIYLFLFLCILCTAAHLKLMSFVCYIMTEMLVAYCLYFLCFQACA